MLDYLIARATKPIKIMPLSVKLLDAWAKTQSTAIQNWMKAAGFKAKPGSYLLLPDAENFIAGVEEGIDRWSLANLPANLPAGAYQLIEDHISPSQASAHAFAWAMGCYRFARYRSDNKTFASLVWPKTADRASVERQVKAIGLARDLINTPAEHMGPADLAKAVEKVGATYKAKVRVIVGDQLLKQNYPTIHAVGRAAAADRQPRLIDLSWKGPHSDKSPLLTLIGKGVCFDTGGLDLKPRGGMMMMKKDMGGAASVLALAQMIMEAKLPLRLRLMIPAVENSVSGNSLRPLDVIKTRKGITVEVNDTDAEGRLILCDAMTEAETQQPDLMIDMATLTGAARVALGPDLPALFTHDDTLAEDLLRHARAEGDPLWRLPLWKPYRRMLDSKVADIANCEPGSFGGAITAALYLAEFVSEKTKWLHIDTYGWTTGQGAGRPEGGEPLAIRSLYAFIEEWLKRTTKQLPLSNIAAPRSKPISRTTAKRSLSRSRPRR